MTAKILRRAPLVLLMLLLALIAPGGLGKPEPDPPEPPMLDWPHDSPIVPTEPAGYLAASTNVGPSGDYRVSVPLDVPPGGAGMAPSLALTYGSEGGNDVAGVGWSLSGTSILQRCAATLAADGFTDGVDFDEDRFCLDGAKLVAVTGQYGGLGTEYRTEQDPFAKIVSVGDGGAGPEQFIVYHEGGRVSTYEPVDTRQTPQHFVWLLGKTSDRSGNSIHYDYTVDDPIDETRGLSILLQRVSYTHHGLIDGRREVVFRYEERPDPSFAYAAAVRTRRDERLSSIEMRAPNPVWTETVWSYELSYEVSPDTGRSLLQSVRKKDAKGQALWAKQFDWAHHTRPSFVHQVFPPELPAPEGLLWSGARVLPVDVDGDGRDELIYRRSQGFADAWMRATQDPASPLHARFVLPQQDPIETGGGRPIDRQHDGRFEILAADHDEPEMWAYRAYRWDAAVAGFVVEPGLGGAVMNPPVIADFDGSGWADTLFRPDGTSGEIVGPSWLLEFGQPPGFSAPIDTGFTQLGSDPLRAGDIDGDGRGDVILTDWSGAPYPVPPGYYAGHTVAIRIADDGTLVKDTRFDLGDSRGIVLADLNGDGLRDAVDLSGNVLGTSVRFNDGEGFRPPVFFPDVLVFSPEDKPGIRVGDFDRDGREDLLIARDDEFEPATAVYLSRPDGFDEVEIESQLHPTLAGGWDTVNLGDFNGDGLLDVAALFFDWAGDDTYNLHLELLVQSEGESDAIVAVRDEGAPKPSETVTYRRAVDRMPGDDSCVHPQRCLLRGTRVVDEVDTLEPDRLTPRRRARYGYAGARSDVLGRGFLGYARVIADDLDTHARVITTYDNVTRDGTTYPFAGLPSVIETITPILSQNGAEGGVLMTVDGTATARVHRTEVSYSTSWQYNHLAYFVRPSRSVETEWEQPCSLAGTAVELLGPAPSPARTVRRVFVHDDHGHRTFESHATDGGVHGEVTQVFEDRTNGDWLLGLLRESYVSEGEPNTSPDARVTFQDYDADGRLRHVVREPFEPALQQTTTLRYDDRGLVTKITRSAPGLVDRRTFFFYDEEGVYAHATENELGHIANRLVHPAFGVPVVTEDPNGVQTTYHYDGFGRLRGVQPEGGVATEIGYSAWGTPGEIRGMHLEATSADGAAAFRRVDPLGRPREEGTAAFDGTWSVATVAYTAQGQAFLRTMPSFGAPGPVTLIQHDTLGRVEWQQAPDGSTTAFTHELFRTTSVDAKGRAHRVDFDGDGRPAEVRDYADDGHEIPLRYRWGDFGQLVRIVDAQAHATILAYDKIGRRTSVIDPDSGETHFEYSAFDEASRIWDSLHDVAYRRDDLGRAVRKEHTHAGITELTTFEYDLGTGAIGRLTSATSPDGVQTELQYDALGQPISSKWTIGGEVFAIERTYGVDGRPDELRYPEAPGRARFSVKAHYNERGYLDSLLPDAGAQAKPFWAVTARTPDGRLAQSTWGAGPTETRSYNPSTGRLDGLRIDKGAPYGASPLFDVAYTYDAGDLVGRTDAVTGREEAFEYDALDRLKKWTLHGPATRTTEYGYDDLGNLTSVAATAAGQPQAAEQLVYDMAVHPHAAHRRTVGADPEVLYHYDARGRLFEGGGRGITWTDFDLPRTITQGGQTVTFLYDAFGARVKKTRTAPGQPTETTISLGGLYERKTAGDKVDHGFFVHGDDGPVTEVVYHEEEGTEDEHLLGRDGHGSLSLVFAANGDVHERLYYEPFGARVTAEGAPIAGTSSGVPWGFTGHREDDDLGLIDMRGRIYDPVLRRFLSPDPIVHDLLAGQTLNHYSYVWNNPLRYVDPTGLDGAGGGEPGGFTEWASETFTEATTWVADFFSKKQPVFKVKPTAQIVPGGPAEANSVAGDIQVDEGSATLSTPSSVRDSSPATPNKLRPGFLGAIPFVAILTAYVNTAESRVEHATKAVDAAAKGDGYHAADHVLAIGQDMAEQAGAPVLDGVRGAIALPGDLKDLVTANNVNDVVAAAEDVAEDGVGIGGTVGLAVGALSRRPPAAGSAINGVDIVGKPGHVGPQPTQLKVHPDIVQGYVDRLRAGEKLPAIDAVELPDGRLFLTEGHHRYVASQLTGIPVNIKVTKNGGPVGFDWKDVIYFRFKPE